MVGSPKPFCTSVSDWYELRGGELEKRKGFGLEVRLVYHIHKNCEMFNGFINFEILNFLLLVV